ncbi:MAG: S1C family serine protease [Spirochaetota bacterium]
MKDSRYYSWSGLVVAACALLLTIASCTTVEQPSTEDAVPEAMGTNEFIETGRRYLALETDDRFLAHLNEHGADHADAREQLLNEYGDAEIAAVNALLESDLPLDALARVWSLAALRGKANALQSLLGRIETALRDVGLNATADDLLLRQGRSLPALPPLDVMSTINDYRAILAELHVVRHYENEDGLRRFSPWSFAGSGFLLSERFLLTAYHVVEAIHFEHTLEYEITVMLNGRRINADLHAWDSILDIAVLKLAEPVDVPVSGLARLSPRRDVTFGESIYGLGHHSGLTETLTSGVVSAPSRRAPEIGSWIQIDAPVTDGASGGMLIGSDGYIQGVLVAGLIGEDLNFAVPSHDVRSVIDRLVAGRSVRRPWLGLSLVDDEWSDEDERGVEIRDVFPSSPLAGYEIRHGDRILEVNHTEVSTVVGVQQLVAALSPGNAVHVKLVTDGKERELWIPAVSRPDYAMYNGHGVYDRVTTLYPFFGVEIDETSPETELVTDEGQSYAVLLYPVTRVDEKSFLASRGVRSGDRVGIVSDHFVGMTRVLQLFHPPNGMSIDELHHAGDYFYTMERGRYDQNIL